MTQQKIINKSASAIDWLMIITLSLLWGGSFFFNGVAVKSLPPFTIVVARLVIAAMTLALVMRIFGHQFPKSKTIWISFFVMGFLNNVIPFSLIVWGQVNLASGVASILNATTPLFTIIVAHFLTQDEKITKSRLVGIIIGFAGVFSMMGVNAIEGEFLIILAMAAVLTAALSYGFAGVFGKRFKAMSVAPMAIATGQVMASSIMLIPVMLIVDRPWLLPIPNLTTWGALFGVAFLSTALAYILYFRILASAGATNLSLVTFLIPVSAILLGVFILDEVLLFKHIIGMSLIAIGLLIIDGRLTKTIFYHKDVI